MAARESRPAASAALDTLDDAGMRAAGRLTEALNHMRMMASSIGYARTAPGDALFQQEVAQDFTAALDSARLALRDLEQASVLRACAALASGQVAPPTSTK